MLKISVQKKGNSLQKLVKNFHKIDGEFVETGHFKEQGKHYSGLTYPELMSVHHNGGNPSGNAPLPPRPVLDLLHFRNQNLSDPKIKGYIRDWRKRPLSEASNKILLDQIGRILAIREKRIFGSPTLASNAVPPKDRNQPLVETGDLKSKVSYKTSIDNSVKGV